MVEILNPTNVLNCLTQATLRANLIADVQAAVEAALGSSLKTDIETATLSITDLDVGSPIMKIGFYTGSGATYQELTSWTVAAQKTGYIEEISFCADLPDTARFKITIGASTVMEDVRLLQDVTLPLPKGATIAAGTKIAVLVKSDGATTIKANASITGKEV